jgi:3-oxoadipate enol-lactonase
MTHIDAGGARISYRLDGPAELPVLMLSNSLGTNLSMWDRQVPAFGRHFRLLRYDSRGHGASDAPPGPYDIARLGRDALALLDALGLKRVRYCGLSKGGMVGMWLATNAPERIERLVLCNTSAHMGNPEMWKQRLETVRVQGMAGIVQGVLERWFTARFRQRAPDVVDAVRRMLLATPAQGYMACGAAIRDMDQRAALASIRAPTLVVAGAHDLATPPDHARLIASSIAGAKLVELDASHLSNIEAEDAFTAAVLDFLVKGDSAAKIW